MKKSKKIILVLMFFIIIIFLVFLLIYSNFIYKDFDIDDGSNNGVLDNSLPEDNILVGYDGETNKDKSNENIVFDSKGNIVNCSEKIKESHSSGGITITNLSISSVNNSDFAIMSFNATNNTDNYVANFSLKFSFYSNDNKVLSEFYLSLPSIPLGETLTIKENTYKRIIDAYDYNFEFVVLGDDGGSGV